MIATQGEGMRLPPNCRSTSRLISGNSGVLNSRPHEGQSHNVGLASPDHSVPRRRAVQVVQNGPWTWSTSGGVAQRTPNNVRRGSWQLPAARRCL